jgi:azurin
MKLTRLFTFITLIAVLAACGGESSQQSRTIEITGLDAMKFAVSGEAEGLSVADDLGSNTELVRLESITVQPGQEITIELTTQSQLPKTAMAHNWVLLTMDADPAAFAKAAIQAKENEYIPQDLTDSIIAHTGLAGGGETVSVTFTAPETTGEYDYICSFPAHYGAGMAGKLIVEESGS